MGPGSVSDYPLRLHARVRAGRSVFGGNGCGSIVCCCCVDGMCEGTVTFACVSAGCGEKKACVGLPEQPCDL